LNKGFNASIENKWGIKGGGGGGKKEFKKFLFSGGKWEKFFG